MPEKQQTDRYCFDKAELADRDWLVPLESALIYCYYACTKPGPTERASRRRKGATVLLSWNVLGLCQSKLGFDTAAANTFNRCLELCPRHAESLSRLAE